VRRLAALALAVVVLGGCGGEVTAPRLEASLATSVLHRYALQQHVIGLAGFSPAGLGSAATCRRTSSRTPLRGAGQDWVCTVRFTATGRAPAAATFAVPARPDGCYAASGPAGTVGPATLRTAAGTLVENPLAAFDGCFDLD